MKRYIWLKVTADKYELPIAVADTAGQLASKLGISANTIVSSVSHSKRLGYRSQYVRVVIDDEEDDDDVNKW